ncbi:MAG: hypothetical protein COU27_01940 [Candidatus Levybacteria bacterium CG10_big_fil_rev_8_21_14_0_10_36_7]|nr:MAG: hypothetical protein COU27_01940 [Candidatus Levybacteria bacterium CG10_big_fil_rev_8_21_14_0_10_36_7]
MREDVKKKSIRRLKIIAGQVNGLIKAVEEGKYCIDVINQSLAVQESLKSVDLLFLENHFNTCLKHKINKKGESEKAIKELLKVYKLSKKK